MSRPSPDFSAASPTPRPATTSAAFSWRLCLSGQGQSEDATPGHRNGFQRAGFSPCAHGIAVSKRRMGASNGARSTCCLPKPSGFKASGRRFGKSVASYVRAKSRRTPSGRSHSTRSSISSPACPPPPRHRRCWASIAIIGGSTEDATPGHRNGFQRAGFSPCAHGIAVSKRRMGASNGARSTCCLPKPSGFKTSGRRFGKSVASYVRAKSRRTPSGRSHSTRSSISSPACPPPPRHRRCWASIAIIGGSRSCIETKDVILGEDGYTNRCDNAPRNIFSLTGFVLKILKSVAPSPTRAIEHFQDDRNRAIRLFSGFY